MPSLSVEYDDDEKEVRIVGLDPEGSDLILELGEAMALYDALGDALPDPDDMDLDDDEDLDESADDDDEDDLEI